MTHPWPLLEPLLLSGNLIEKFVMLVRRRGHEESHHTIEISHLPLEKLQLRWVHSGPIILSRCAQDEDPKAERGQTEGRIQYLLIQKLRQNTGSKHTEH